MSNLEILAQHNRERLAKAKEQYLGKTFSSNNYGDFIVVDYVNNKDITVEFIGTGERRLGYYNTEIEAFDAYKQAKENYLKQLAEKWKDQIDERAYNALMNYQVEITD